MPHMTQFISNILPETIMLYSLCGTYGDTCYAHNCTCMYAPAIHIMALARAPAVHIIAVVMPCQVHIVHPIVNLVCFRA